MSLKDTIRALSLKTVANGSTEAEEAAAKKMIKRLSSGSVPKKAEKYPNQSFNDLSVREVDWDAVAKEYLTHVQHGEYVTDTHAIWEIYNQTRLGLDRHRSISRDEYREKCHEVFWRLFDRKQIG